MKIKINKSDIINSLSNIQSITNKRSNLIINNCILLRAEKNHIYISATDFETSFEGVYNADIEEEGKIVVNAKHFFEIIKDFPMESVGITNLENKNIEIKSEKVSFKLLNIVEEFPKLPNIKNTIFFIDIKSFKLKSMIDKITTIEHLDREDDGRRTYLYGVGFKKEKDDEIVMISTDIKRFSIIKYKNSTPINYTNEKSILIDKKGLKEAGKFLDINDDNVKIGICDDKYFIIKKPNEIIVINIIEGSPIEYDYSANLKEENNIEINKQEFLMSLKRMSILSSNEDDKSLTFNLKEDKLFITYKSSYTGESEEYINIKRESKKEIKVNYNPKNFTEILNKIEEDTFILNISFDNSQCFIKGKSDESFLSIFTPIVDV